MVFINNIEFPVGTPQPLNDELISILSKAKIDILGFSHEFPEYHFSIHNNKILQKYVLVLTELKEDFEINQQLLNKMIYFPIEYIEKYKFKKNQNIFTSNLPYLKNYNFIIYPVLETDKGYYISINKITLK